MARTVVLVALFGVVLLICPSIGSAEPPPNDNFADATEITGLPAEVMASTVGATREPGEPTPEGDSIWFRWTAPATGAVAMFTWCEPQSQDMHGSSASAYVQSPVFGLLSVTPSGGPRFTFRAVAGQVYWIAVTSFFDPDVCLRLVPGSTNDEFAAATRLTGFPAAATYATSPQTAPETTEPGEPIHDGLANPPLPLGGTVWYSWTAPADRRVVLRVCGGFGAVAVYTGDRVDALDWVLTRRARAGSCPATATFDAVEGKTYRIAVTNPRSFELLIGTQVAVLAGQAPTPTTAGVAPTFFYSAFPGDADKLKVRLTGAGLERALLVEAAGVTAANGCSVDAAPGNLRCPIPGRAAVVLDVDLGDANDSADVRLPGLLPPSSDYEPPVRRVLGGDGDDKLAGSAGVRRQDNEWVGGLALIGEGGADRITGGPGSELITGGPGADWIDPGASSDSVSGGSGADRVRSVDGASDTIGCNADRDHARLDGVDLPRGCERRKLSSPARAAATFAALSNDDGDDSDHLAIGIACPIDVHGGCRTTIAMAGARGRIITRRLRLAPGRSGVVSTYRLAAMGSLESRGVRVTVSTRRRGRAPLKVTQHLPVADARYEGE